jgi:predicted DCC family thiol-disulfide oxidoreductase YuxK
VVGPAANKKIILFDGVCNLCNATVRFVLKRDKQQQFIFGSLQGNTGQELLKSRGLSADTFHSFVLIAGDKTHTRSAGVLEVLRTLKGGWQLLYPLIFLPRFIRDGLYNLIARNRYRWFGKKEYCMVPEARWSNRFLD